MRRECFPPNETQLALVSYPRALVQTALGKDRGLQEQAQCQEVRRRARTPRSLYMQAIIHVHAAQRALSVVSENHETGLAQKRALLRRGAA
jgi:hypothetical protein